MKNLFMNNIFDFILERKYIGIGVLLTTIVILIIAILILSSRKRTKSRRKTNYNKSKKQYTLDDCKSYEDLEFKIDTYQNNFKNELTKNKQVIQNAKKRDT